MKKILSLFALTLIIFNSNAQVVDTWDVDGTQLNEYNFVTGLQIPWEIIWGPDNMIWCTTRIGEVLRIDPETGSYTTVLDIDVFGGQGSEAGLLGMAMHPDWNNTPKVYLAYCTGNGWQNAEENLSVFDWNGTELVNEEVLITVEAGGIHNGSRLLVLPDNTLLMTTGDTGDDGESSQDLSSLNGKTLRLNLDGTVPADNPWPGSYVYTWGHRNSQGLCLGPTGIIYSSEHGQSNWDEFNIIEEGRNYGWPDVEGECGGAAELAFCEAFNVMEPIRSWAPCIAVNGIEYYDHPAIPSWNNAILMSVLGGLSNQYERLSILHLSEDGLSVVSEEQYFSSFNERIRDIAINPNTGAVYMALNGYGWPGSGPNIIKEFRPDEYDSTNELGEDKTNAIIYPVPAKDNLNIDVTTPLINGQYDIINYGGQSVLKGIISTENTTLNVSDLARGNYYIRIFNNTSTVTRTFTLQ